MSVWVIAICAFDRRSVGVRNYVLFGWSPKWSVGVRRALLSRSGSDCCRLRSGSFQTSAVAIRAADRLSSSSFGSVPDVDSRPPCCCFVSLLLFERWLCRSWAPSDSRRQPVVAALFPLLLLYRSVTLLSKVV